MEKIIITEQLLDEAEENLKQLLEDDIPEECKLTGVHGPWCVDCKNNGHCDIQC